MEAKNGESPSNKQRKEKTQKFTYPKLARWSKLVATRDDRSEIGGVQKRGMGERCTEP